MTASSSHSMTQLLLAWRQGDAAALEELVPLVYQKLRRLARHYMAGQRAGHTLQATALVNEAYVRLIDCQQVNWKDRAHFFAISAQMMRRVLVEFARSRQYQKRGGGARKTSLDEALIASPERGHDLVALDDALQALATSYPRQSQVVELRFFGGLSVEETAEVLKVSAVTVMRDWQLAKVWLARELKKRDSHVRGTVRTN
jgi:RNA polymerase sigma factor (TIGR02999 family)